VVTKYYYLGSQRVAMRKNGNLNFILTDHLGSTSLVTDANGAVISETKYKSWGETRYSSGTEQTKYTYTGQYSYVSEFGLHFYNARWYDSSLGRFAQADTIVPLQQGVQAWDRYAYVNNSPVRYTDPSGHRNCEEDGYNCAGDDITTWDVIAEIESVYDVDIKGNPGLGILLNLQKTLNNYAETAGGVENLNDIFNDAMRANNFSGKIGIAFVPGNGSMPWERDQNGHPFMGNGFHTAAWCDQESEMCDGFSGNIILSENVFTENYQFRQTAYDRQSIIGRDLNLAIQITMAHEMSHVLVDARPNILGLYNGGEEAMANTIANYVITGGSTLSPSESAFITNIQSQGLWNSTWFYPNWP
jgi:RHS repeat-associated protein